ncbi:CSC1-like protein [Seminavis robusta]|uniref:CSC1-like protein n=1 Tax=Seminavis robusta TaxID=568900 RepID=A0A9N8HN24_9STRA|nr:CSC1-like protein [Seminavis robusta]|eukprot:Sro951_g223830.1 CSC1-like protein (971) ;mRNA; r:5788-9317
MVSVMAVVLAAAVLDHSVVVKAEQHQIQPMNNVNVASPAQTGGIHDALMMLETEGLLDAQNLLETQRFLEDDLNNSSVTTNDGNSTSNSTTAAPEAPPAEKDSTVLRATFTTYGSVFLGVFFLLCILRKRFKRAFNLRDWVDDRKSDLAKNQFGWLSWTWRLAMIKDEVFMIENGMDSTCFVRVTVMGIKLCMVGMFCALFLFPCYYTAPKTQETMDVNDWVKKLTTGNVGSGSPRLIATVVAAYVVFGSTMKLIKEEMEWFAGMRHRYLRRKLARNYAIYLRNIPPHYQNNKALKHFFERCLGVELEEAHITMKTSNLQKAVAERADTVARLEHAVAEEEIHGERPRHSADNLIVPVGSIMGGQTVDSIDFYVKQLKAQNKDVTERIETLRENADKDMEVRAANSGDDVDVDNTSDTAEEDTGFLTFVRSSAVNVVSNVAENTTSLTTGATGLVASAAGQAVNLLTGDEDGAVYSAGFIVFKKLSHVQTALRMTHYEVPYSMECLEAPDPQDIFWKNVGREHKDLQVGSLFSLAATAATCLLWTIPVSFVSSLSSVDALRKQFGFIDDVLNAAPWLVPILEVFAPQFLVILNAMLPVILTVFTQLEGPISGAAVEASLFVKLSMFMIIQTFFVSAISGGIFEELNRLLADYTAIIDLLGKSLPAQSTFFMQMAIVMTVTTSAIEGLRVAPLALAFVRKFVGPKLTEKERSTTFMGLTPLNEPSEFQHADFLSNMVLFFIIFLVYAVIAPMVSFILALCFGVMGTLFRHQFVYIYNSNPDSGGFLFLNFIHILTSCMLIGEITIRLVCCNQSNEIMKSGLLTLKKSPVAVLNIPLIVCTVLFNYYIRQQHFTVAQHLPSRLCRKQDQKNNSSGMCYDFVQDAYLQPELREPRVLPEVSDDLIGDLRLLADDDEVESGTVASAVTCRVTKLRLSAYEPGDGEGGTPDASWIDERSGTAPDSQSMDLDNSVH